MSNLDRLKSMPYRVDNGGIEMAKIRCAAAIITAAKRKSRRDRISRWSVPIAAAILLFVGVTIGVRGAQSEYDRFIDQLADVPESILYEMSVDAVEYGDEIYIL